MKRWFEPTCAILMALAAVATAWCSYQSSSWSSESSDLASESAKLHRESNMIHLDSRQIEAMQTRLFMEAIDAQMDGNDKLAKFYTARFADELQPAYAKWLELDLFNNLDAPPTPFSPVIYTPRFDQEIHDSRAQATRAEQRSKITGHTASSYLGNTVSLATVLLFAAMAEKFDQRRVRHGSLAFAVALFLYSSVRAAMLPVNLS
ncbi:MAG: hypothetical protein V4640_14365 [Verrucomicrobiota bacterium]